MKTNKYYDFYFGVPHSKKPNWTFQPVKMFGHSPSDAINRYFKTNKLHDNFMLNWIRQVDEYELVKRNGLTLYQFKSIVKYKVDIIDKRLCFITL